MNAKTELPTRTCAKCGGVFVSEVANFCPYCRAAQSLAIDPREGETMTIRQTAVPDIITIHANGEAVVTIKPDGTLIYGPNYEPDEAAQIFWQAIIKNMPLVLREKVDDDDDEQPIPSHERAFRPGPGRKNI